MKAYLGTMILLGQFLEKCGSGYFVDGIEIIHSFTEASVFTRKANFFTGLIKPFICFILIVVLH